MSPRMGPGGVWPVDALPSGHGYTVVGVWTSGRAFGRPRRPPIAEPVFPVVGEKAGRIGDDSRGGMGISESVIVGIVVSLDIDHVFTGNGESAATVGSSGQVAQGTVHQFEPMTSSGDPVLTADIVTAGDQSRLVTRLIAIESKGGVAIGQAKSISQIRRSPSVQLTIFVYILASIQGAIRGSGFVARVNDVLKTVLARFNPKQRVFQHASAVGKVENVTDKVKEGEIVKVKVLDIDSRGKVKLSMKEAEIE